MAYNNNNDTYYLPKTSKNLIYNHHSTKPLTDLIISKQASPEASSLSSRYNECQNFQTYEVSISYYQFVIDQLHLIFYFWYCLFVQLLKIIFSQPTKPSLFYYAPPSNLQQPKVQSSNVVRSACEENLYKKNSVIASSAGSSLITN